MFPLASISGRAQRTEVAYLWIDDVFVGRIPYDQQSWRCTCGLPCLDAFTMLLDAGLHSYRIEAYASEACTMVTGSSLLCGGSGTAPAFVEQGEFTVSEGACQAVAVDGPAHVSADCTHEGDLVIDSTTEDIIPTVCEVTGDVSIGVKVNRPTFGRLVRIGGSLIMSDTDNASLSLPELIEVGESILIERNPLLGTVSMPKLRATRGNGGAVNLVIADGIIDLDLRSLETVPGDFDVRRTNARWLEFPALKTIAGTLYAVGHAAHTIEYPVLETVGGSIAIWLNNDVDTMSFPALESVGDGDDNVSVDDNLALTTFECPSLTKADSLRFTKSPSLNTLSFPSLTTLGGISTDGSTQLTACALDEIATQSGGSCSECSDCN